jgi:hypothetical protein
MLRRAESWRAPFQGANQSRALWTRIFTPFGYMVKNIELAHHIKNSPLRSLRAQRKTIKIYAGFAILSLCVLCVLCG